MTKHLNGLIAGALLGIGVAATPLVAVADDAMNIIKYRVTSMKSLGAHMGALGAIAKGKVSFTGHAAAHAQGIAAVAKYVGEMFPEGSDFGETRAKPEIWSESTKFKAAVTAFQAQAAKLAQVAASGDRAALGAQLGAVGKTCGGCHKSFRKKKK